MDKTIIITMLIVACIVGLLIWYFFHLSTKTYITTEEVEAKPSPYRGEEVTALMTIIEYWIDEVLPENSQPRIYSTDDYAISFVNYGTTNGLLRCGINWQRNTLDLHYSKHDEAEGRCIELRRTVRRDNDTAIVDFLLEVKKAELSLAADTADLLSNLQTVATSPEAVNEMEGRSTGSVLITLCVFLTSYLIRQKRPSNILTSLYRQLTMLLYQRYNDEMQAFLKENLPTSDEKADPSE